MALLAWLVMYDYGWRMLIGLSSTPLLLFVFFGYWLPESPLYLATIGRQEDMEYQIKKVWIDPNFLFFLHAKSLCFFIKKC